MRLRLQFVCDCGAIEIGDNNAENVTQWSVIRQIQILSCRTSNIECRLGCVLPTVICIVQRR